MIKKLINYQHFGKDNLLYYEIELFGIKYKIKRR